MQKREGVYIMRKIVSLVLVIIVLFSFTACGKKKTAAFKLSNDAFWDVDKANDLVERFSEDIYQAWYMGINERDLISGKNNDETALKNLAEELHISEADIKKAVAELYSNGDTDTYETGDWYSLYTYGFNDSVFSAAVAVVSQAYECNGISDDIEKLLESAKNQMKQISDDHSDYEHYPNLKKYFATTSAFYDFCQNPEGSFEQVVETFNDYRNKSREYCFDLRYVFDN